MKSYHITLLLLPALLFVVGLGCDDKREQQWKEQQRQQQWESFLSLSKDIFRYDVLLSVTKSEEWISKHLNETTLDLSDYLNEDESLEWLSENGYEVEKSLEGSRTIKHSMKTRNMDITNVISIGHAPIIGRPLKRGFSLTTFDGKMYIKNNSELYPPWNEVGKPFTDVFYGTGLPSGVDSFVIAVDPNDKHRVLIRKSEEYPTPPILDQK